VNNVAAAAGLGADLVDTLNTAAAWTAGGGNTVADDSGEVKNTYVNNATGMQTSLAGAVGLSGDLTARYFYAVAGNTRVNAGTSASIGFENGTGTTTVKTVTETANTAWGYSFAHDGTLSRLKTSGMGAGEIIWLSGMTVKQINNSTSTAFAPVIASTMQAGAYNSTLQANGVLDGERYYTRALTADEIAKLYRLNGR
jgi:hypothetical protein